MLITIIGRGHSGTRSISHPLSASGVYMGEPLNLIAERYGVSANKLGVMMHRLRKKFRQKLIKDGVCTEGGGIV